MGCRCYGGEGQKTGHGWSVKLSRARQSLLGPLASKSKNMSSGRKGIGVIEESSMVSYSHVIKTMTCNLCLEYVMSCLFKQQTQNNVPCRLKQRFLHTCGHARVQIHVSARLCCKFKVRTPAQKLAPTIANAKQETGTLFRLCQSCHGFGFVFRLAF